MECYFCRDKQCIHEPNYGEGYHFYQCNVCGRYVITESEIMRWQRSKLDRDIVAAYLYHNVRLLAEDRDPSYACVISSGPISTTFFEEHPYFHLVSYDEMKAFYPRSIADRTRKILLAIAKKSQFPGDQIEMSCDEEMSLLFIRRFGNNGEPLEDMDLNMQFEHIMKHLESNEYASISNDSFGTVYVRLLSQGQEYMESVETESRPSIIMSEFLSKQIESLLETEHNGDTAEAIGKAKELIESCCRTILDERGIKWEKDWALHELTGETMEVLGIRPRDVQGTDDIDKATKALLSNLAQITQRVAEIRNLAGSGHGRPENFKPAESRYAQLTVGASISIVRFLWSTHLEIK